MPAACIFPLVCHSTERLVIGLYGLIETGELMSHGQTCVVFVVDGASNGTDCPARRNLFDKHDTAARLAIDVPHNVETQVQFFKMSMMRNRKAQNPSIAK